MQSARKLFGAEGLSVPFSSVAKDAGVSQGVLYRHFASRLDLGLAVFEENLDHIEMAVEARPADQDAFTACWTQLVNRTIVDVAFVETAIHAASEPRLQAVSQRIEDFMEPLLEQARDRGVVAADMTYKKLNMALRAIYGLVATSVPGQALREEVGELLRGMGLPEPASADPAVQ